MIVDWHVKPGDTIIHEQSLLDIETSKIVNSVESQCKGIVSRILEQPGATVAVGQLVGVIAQAATPESEIDKFVEEFQTNYTRSEKDQAEESNSKFIEVNNQRIHYLAFERADTQGSAVVMIHGFGGDSGNWMFNIAEIASRRCVYALDLPGHGASTKAINDGSIAALASTVIAFSETIGLDRFHLIGHSLGGGVAMEVTKMQADPVMSLALIAPTGLGTSISHSYINGFVEGCTRRNIKQTLGMLFSDKNLVTREMTENTLRYKRLDGVRDALCNIAQHAFPEGAQQYDFRDWLNALSSLPVMVIWGAADEVVSVDQLDGLQEHINTQTIADAGHMPHMEAAGRVNRLLSSHLSRADI